MRSGGGIARSNYRSGGRHSQDVAVGGRGKAYYEEAIAAW